MRRTEKRSESPYNEVNTINLTVQGVYNYPALGFGLVAAQEDVTGETRDAEPLHNILEALLLAQGSLR